jgi:hypothetical protein
MKSFKKFIEEFGDADKEEVNEIFGIFDRIFNTQKAQMKRGASKIANEVVLDKIIKPALSSFKDAFEDVKIVEDKSKNYVMTGYSFKIHLDVSDKYLSRVGDGKTYYIDGDLARKVNDTISHKYRQWKSENKDDIISQMIPGIDAFSTFEGNIKNKDGGYEQNIVIKFRIIDGGINKMFKK